MKNCAKSKSKKQCRTRRNLTADQYYILGIGENPEEAPLLVWPDDVDWREEK